MQISSLVQPLELFVSLLGDSGQRWCPALMEASFKASPISTRKLGTKASLRQSPECPGKRSLIMSSINFS